MLCDFHPPPCWDVAEVRHWEFRPRADVFPSAAVMRLAPPPYVLPQRYAVYVGKPLFKPRPTLRVAASPWVTFIVEPDKSGGFLAVKLRF